MSTAVLPVHIGLASESTKVSFEALAPVAAALQSQAQRDFHPVWKVAAVVSAFPSRSAIPNGYQPIVIQDKLDDPDALGYHTDVHGQPISFVEYGDGWSVTCSHEMLEMLADPHGYRLWSTSEPYGHDRVRMLIEVADPCESVEYVIGGIRVSDFVTPAYYHTAKSFHTTTFTGQKLNPRELLDGGYVSYEKPDGSWWQATGFGRRGVEKKSLGRIQDFAFAGESLREACDRVAREHKRAFSA